MPLMNANRSPLMNSSGMSWPSCFVQLRLVVEQIELRRRAGHEQIDDALRLGREVRRARRERAVSLLRSAANRRSSSSASATPPMPKPDCRKKCRRVTAPAAVVSGVVIGHLGVTPW